MKTVILVFWSSLLSCACLLPAYAQTKPPAPAKEADYSQQAAVIELMDTQFIFENDGTWTRQQTSRIRVQTDAGVKEWGILVFPFESDTQTLELDYVRVRKPDGTMVNTSPDDSRDLDSQITQAAPLYSDLREKHVPVRGLAPGDILEYAAHWHATKVLTPGQFWVSYAFTRTSIVLNETLDVSVPADRAITISGPADTQNMTMDGSRRKYTWSNSRSNGEHQAENRQRCPR